MHVKQMRVGYVEFNHKAYKFIAEDDGSAFFTKVTDGLKENAKNPHCDGFTNYQYALEQVMEEYESVLPKRRRSKDINGHVLFLTDGIPTRTVCCKSASSTSSARTILLLCM